MKQRGKKKPVDINTLKEKLMELEFKLLVTVQFDFDIPQPTRDVSRFFYYYGEKELKPYAIKNG